MTQHIKECSERIATGALQLGEDWPGYFMRGDEALFESNLLYWLADAIERDDPALLKAAPIYLRRLASDLATCRSN